MDYMPSIRTARPNLTHVTVGTLSVTFSYTTPVAFYHPVTGQVVSENVWSKTTGRHLNEVDGGTKRNRLPRADFVKVLELVGHGGARNLNAARRIVQAHKEANL